MGHRQPDKCVLDALTRAGVWLDDEQVDELHLTRCSLDPNKQGFALVTVEVLP
jgi:Holliday junction resolvase RusA-like endonuclease